jgi:hypothetical protein
VWSVYALPCPTMGAEGIGSTASTCSLAEACRSRRDPAGEGVCLESAHGYLPIRGSRAHGVRNVSKGTSFGYPRTTTYSSSSRRAHQTSRQVERRGTACGL